MKVLTKFLPFLPYLIVFIFSLYAVGDPDLGWHLKYGQYFFTHWSVLRDNTFSTMLPNYHWANTSWLTDVVSYGVFHLSGFMGLSILGAIVVTATFYFVSRIADLSLWEQSFLFPLLLYLEQPINAVSFRGQQLSLLFIVILFYIFKLSKEHKKKLYLAIPLFFVWANVNGEFLFGLGLFALWISIFLMSRIFSSLSEMKWSRRVKTSGLRQPSLPAGRAQAKILYLYRAYKKDLIILIFSFISSLLVTFLNPFGWGIHLAALSHFGSPLLKYVAEYLPFDMFTQVWWNQVIVGILIVLGFIYLFFKNKVSQELPLLLSFIFVFLLSFEVRRYAWPAYYLVLPLLRPVPDYFRPDSKNVTKIFSIVFLFVLLGISLGAKYPYTQLTTYNWNTYCYDLNIQCSPKSAAFLIQHHLSSNLLSLYSWGGWLIWNYPQIKPTIDGRMHLWSEHGYSAFLDYYNYEQNFADIDTSKYNVVYMPPDKPIYNQMIRLVNEGKWKQVYGDDEAGIFVRKTIRE